MAAQLRGLRRELKQVTEEYARTVKRDLEDVVSDWSEQNRPKFTVERRISPTEIRVFVRPYKRRTASRIFGYVDQGTKPHTIRPKKRGGVLAFQWGGPGSYQPKTRPIAQAHGPGKVVGGGMHFAKAVRHPGSKGRHFLAAIHKRRAPQFRRDVENTFRRARRKMNSGK